MTDTTIEPSTARPSASPDALVDRLFRRFHAMYGARWLDQWIGAPIDAVKAEWACAVAGYEPAAFKAALDALIRHGKPYPPTLPEFVALLRQSRPQRAPLRLITDARRDPPPGGFQALRDILAKR